MIIAFVGFMGVGKTTISNFIAKKDGFKIISSDLEIELGTNLKIKDIFAKYGEQYFRDLEYETIKNIIENNGDNFILDLGGGAFVQEKNRQLLKNRVKTIYLKIPFEILLERLSLEDERKNRPILQKENWQNETRKLFESRKKFYELADVTISADKSVEKIYEIIKEQI
ncbi:MAG: shikimate kinase [Rickettsiales bacterium]|jgi:shikimate kinase|nr:shikimate kinase [Rickettsiales bacterium]